MRTGRTLAFAGTALFLALSFGAAAQESSGTVELQSGWRIIGEKQAHAGGVDMSTSLLGDKGYAIERMPSTVLNALAKAGVYEDIYYGDNLAKVDQDLWKQRWWYQTEVDVPAGHNRYTLIFNGINHRGEIWLNGQPIAGSDEIAGMNRKYEFDVTDIVRPGESNILLTLQRHEDLGPVYFVRLRLLDADGTQITENTYWQAAKDDIPVDMDPSALMDAMTTKQSQWADFTALNSMPQAPLERTVKELESNDDFRQFEITLKNPSAHIAFFVRAELRADATSGEILPITYSDNYVTVYPGETRRIGAQIARSQLSGAETLLFAEGYNVQPQ